MNQVDQVASATLSPSQVNSILTFILNSYSDTVPTQEERGKIINLVSVYDCNATLLNLAQLSSGKSLIFQLNFPRLNH